MPIRLLLMDELRHELLRALDLGGSEARVCLFDDLSPILRGGLASHALAGLRVTVQDDPAIFKELWIRFSARSKCSV